jgi:hypothetical protein
MWQIVSAGKRQAWGSCIFVSNVINVREVLFFFFRKFKELELSVTESVDFKIMVICIYNLLMVMLKPF